MSEPPTSGWSRVPFELGWDDRPTRVTNGGIVELDTTPADAGRRRSPTLTVTLANFAAEEPSGWEHLLARAELFDQVGVGRLVVSDHVAFGEDLDAYGRPEIGGTAGGRQPTGPDGHWLEPLTTLAVVAGRTRRIRLGTNILIAALRRPVVLAKTAATLDVLSDGRLDLGVGVGWQREEYEAAGLDFAGRGRLLDETLDGCRTLWSDHRADFSGEHLHFEGIHQMPKPRQPGGVPIWVSGRVNRRVVERVGRFGSGWIPWGDDAADPVAGAARMRTALEASGFDPTGLQIAGRLVVTDTSLPGLRAAMAAVPPQVEAGITDLRLGLRLPADLNEAGDVLNAVLDAFSRRTL